MANSSYCTRQRNARPFLWLDKTPPGATQNVRGARQSQKAVRTATGAQRRKQNQHARRARLTRLFLLARSGPLDSSDSSHCRHSHFQAFLALLSFYEQLMYGSEHQPQYGGACADPKIGSPCLRHVARKFRTNPLHLMRRCTAICARFRRRCGTGRPTCNAI